MLIVKGQTAINIDACKIIRAEENLFEPKIIFDDAFGIGAKKPAQALKEILEAYERGAKVYRIEE